MAIVCVESFSVSKLKAASLHISGKQCSLGLAEQNAFQQRVDDTSSKSQVDEVSFLYCALKAVSRLCSECVVSRR